MERIFLLSKGEDAKALIRKIYTNKVLSQQCFSMTGILLLCNIFALLCMSVEYPLLCLVLWTSLQGLDHYALPRCVKAWIIMCWNIHYVMPKNFMRTKSLANSVFLWHFTATMSESELEKITRSTLQFPTVLLHTELQSFALSHGIFFETSQTL